MKHDQRTLLRGLFLVTVLSIAGCHDLTNTPGLPAGTPSPTYFNNKAGAVGMRNVAVLTFEQAVPAFLIESGLLTDELEDVNTGAGVGVLLSDSKINDPLDERILPEGTQTPNNSYTYDGFTGAASYINLQNVRATANQALGALVTYDTAAADIDSVRVFRGELYALEGFAEIYLADLFCSGVPLSTLDFQKDFTYKPSSTTQQVYQDAIAKFDTALMVAATSDSVMNLARIGKGRAELALGNYGAAADDVSTIPSTFQYTYALNTNDFAAAAGSDYSFANGFMATVSDREGGNGLPFLSSGAPAGGAPAGGAPAGGAPASGDPRTAVDILQNSERTSFGGPFIPITNPQKYSTVFTSFGSFVLASGIEARLIQAEAQLQPVSAPRGPWLQTINALRESLQLPDTTDPGTAAGRIALVFRERAFWLFVDGHRQGDLRRMIRQYGNYGVSQDRVYPTGVYRAPGTGVYGTDVTAPIPSSESLNPLYHGCIDRRA